MSGYTKLAPIKGRAYCGCGCGSREDHARMEDHPHPGFGGLSISRDDDGVWPWDHSGENLTFQDIEDVAAGDPDHPDHDWRIRINGPLADYTYQRQGEGKWALVEQGRGFA